MPEHDFDYVVIGGGMVGCTVASLLAKTGKKVALIERGKATLPPAAIPQPQIRLTQRDHLGCSRARNQVLGGNGYFWGGGLMRPPSTRTLGCLGITQNHGSDKFDDLAPHFMEIERTLLKGRSPVRSTFPVNIGGVEGCDLAEIGVIPGKLRNTSVEALLRMESSAGSEVMADREIVGFVPRSRDSKRCVIESVMVRHGTSIEAISTKHVVIAAGAIDSNLLVIQNAESLCLSDRVDSIGSSMHDHFSVPLARVSLSRKRNIRELLAPQFHRGAIFGRHFELSCDGGWRARGFLHFQFHFDEISPYREIKRILLKRQQRVALREVLEEIPPLVWQAPELARIAIERFLRGRLYISDRLPVTATLDFESFPHPDQKLRLTTDHAEFSWQITQQDEATFLELSRKAERLLAHLAATYGIEIYTLSNTANETEARRYLHASATDAFHLGGGLAADAAADGLTDTDLRLAGTENVHVLSSAVFRRPGVVNPTHTLFALARRFVASQSNAREAGIGDTRKSR